MDQSSTAPATPATPHLHLIRDEAAPLYDGQPVRSSGYVTMNDTDITRTIIGTLGPAYAVYAYLDTYCNEGNQCWPSLDRMVEEIANMGKTTIHRHLVQLVNAGWIIRERRTNAFGMHAGYTYTLPHRGKQQEPANVRGSKPIPNPFQTHSKPIPPEGVELSTKLNTKVLSKVDTPLPPGFESFWNAYPRKVSRHAALQAWRKIKPDEDTVASMLATIQSWSTSHDWQKDGGRFIPHPATWLNNKRWEDDPPPEGTSSPDRDIGYTTAELAALGRGEHVEPTYLPRPPGYTGPSGPEVMEIFAEMGIGPGT